MKRPALTVKQREYGRVQRALLALRRAAVVHTNNVDAVTADEPFANAAADASYQRLEESAFRYANALALRDRKRLS